MILIDNVLYLKKRFPDIWEKVKSMDNKTLMNIQAVPAKSGEDTLVAEVDGRPLYMHSKYNPIEEAEQFINQFAEVDKYQHVFFYGIGLGYHIDAFVKKYPNISFTLYEPEVEVFARYLAHKELKGFTPKQLKSIFVENGTDEANQYLTRFVEHLNEEMLLIQLPSYDRVFAAKNKYFNEKFTELLSQRKLMFRVYANFEKRWTFNSMVNLETTLHTPNIIEQKRKYFQDKPVIIVAAGPSLQEEIEHLKYIKAHGLAYIFSVGTSINALLAYGIEPDAACTYDPSETNQKVFEKLKSIEGTTVPIIYGSSVGFEVIKDYNGPKLHMLTTQDGIASYYLQSSEGKPLEFIQDAPSVSVIVLQLLQKLKCNPVIFVGQNLAFKNDQMYSSEANVVRDSGVGAEDKAEALLVESVDGGQVETTKDFNIMRFQLEMFIKASKDMEVINTTIGGAKIANTTYMPLQDFIATRLKDKVVEQDWISSEKTCYNADYAIQKAAEMKLSHEQMTQYFEQMTRFFNDMNRLADRKNTKGLGKLFPKFDKLFTKVLANLFFNTFIKPMNKIYFDILLQNIEKMRFENDFVAKARLIIQEFGKFMYLCHSDALMIEPLFHVIQEEVITKIPREA